MNCSVQRGSYFLARPSPDIAIAILQTSSMRVAAPKDIPEYEIIPSQLVFKDTKYKMPEVRELLRFYPKSTLMQLERK